MKLERTSAPVNNPVSNALVEQQLWVSSGESSLIIANAIKYGTDSVERDTDRSLITQTWTMHLDAFPCDDVIYVPKGKISSVTTFKYLNTSNVLTTLVADTDYYITSVGDEQRITPVTSWPSVSSDKLDAVQLVWVSGYGANDTDIPEWAKQAVLLKCKEAYDSTDVQEAYDSLIYNRRLLFDYSNKNLQWD